ncbi:hypothetical protein E3J49_02805 [Candidatus Bathyarchaeota archaeon]|nr:MAG: hypothetical protein E3J49_02805 [Candidatus Bathyarchaeota archaeon]
MEQKPRNPIWKNLVPIAIGVIVVIAVIIILQNFSAGACKITRVQKDSDTIVVSDVRCMHTC